MCKGCAWVRGREILRPEGGRHWWWFCNISYIVAIRFDNIIDGKFYQEA